MAEFKEEDHPRDEDGKFTSGSGESKKESSQALKNYAGDNAYKYEVDKNFDDVSDEDIMTELSDGDYYYGNLDEQEIYDLMAKRLDITPKRAEEGLKNQGFNFEEYQKYINSEEPQEKDKDKPYDFDKWAKETGSQKEKHIAYIDTDKKYTPQDVFDIIVSDNDNWNIQGTIADGSKVLFSHKTGPTYTFDKNTGKVELTTKELENKKGLEAHTKELTNYIQDQIKKGATNPETIYQNSPYSIHSYDEMINIANDLLKKSNNDTIDYENVS